MSTYLSLAIFFAYYSLKELPSYIFNQEKNLSANILFERATHLSLSPTITASITYLSFLHLARDCMVQRPGSGRNSCCCMLAIQIDMNKMNGSRWLQPSAAVHLIHQLLWNSHIL